MEPDLIEKELHEYKKHFRVSIFGSARLDETHDIYHEIFKLAQMLADEGIDVVTGGGPGLMEAANAGSQSSKNADASHSFGLNIKLPKEQYFNRHLDIKKDFERFSDRLDTFMELSNAIVVAPGGVGTLLEFFYTWQLAQVHHICHIPIILLGNMWSGLIEWIEKWPLKGKLLNQEDLNLLFLADNAQESMKIILKAHEEFKKGDKDFCLNHSKYHID